MHRGLQRAVGVDEPREDRAERGVGVEGGEQRRERARLELAVAVEEQDRPASPRRRAVKDAGREDRIRFVGYRRDVPAVMRGLDVLVLASDAEPCGRVLFEAMASGTAIVATNSGGTPEIVRDGREGRLVPPRDPAALARAIGALVADRNLRARLGAAGVARVAAEFTLERYVARTLAVYDAALAGRRA